MSYSLIIRPEAELDIQEAFEWYESQTLGLCSEFVRAVDACLSNIGRAPLAYPCIYQQARRHSSSAFLMVFSTSLSKRRFPLLLAFTANAPQSRGRIVFNVIPCNAR